MGQSPLVDRTSEKVACPLFYAFFYEKLKFSKFDPRLASHQEKMLIFIKIRRNRQ